MDLYYNVIYIMLFIGLFSSEHIHVCKQARKLVFTIIIRLSEFEHTHALCLNIWLCKDGSNPAHSFRWHITVCFTTLISLFYHQSEAILKILFLTIFSNFITQVCYFIFMEVWLPCMASHSVKDWLSLSTISGPKDNMPHQF